MPTNDERREVAAKLRELPIDMYEVKELWEMKGLDTCCKDQTDYYLIHFALFGCFPADHMHPCDYEELHARLADLIEPEERTCHIIEQVETGPTSSGKVHRCSACGKPLPGWLFKERRIVSYCFKCGAKVVE